MGIASNPEKTLGALWVLSSVTQEVHIGISWVSFMLIKSESSGTTIPLSGDDMNAENLLQCLICSTYSADTVSEMLEHIGNLVLNFCNQGSMSVFQEIFGHF